MIDALNLIKSSGKQSTTLEDGFLVVGTMASGSLVQQPVSSLKDR